MTATRPTAGIADGGTRPRVEDCYQCGKCTAGCPVADRMDLMPHQLVRLAQLGDQDEAASTAAVWLCVSCQVCSQRCPKGVDVAGVMDAARRRSAATGTVHPDAMRTVIFQRAFLATVRRNGRLHELELMARYKAGAFLRDANLPLLVKDAQLGPELLRRRRMPLRAGRVADRGVVKRIFARCLDGEHAQADAHDAPAGLVGSLERGR